MKRVLYSFLAIMAVVSCGKPAGGEEKKPDEKPSQETKAFVTGADVSWASEMGKTRTFKGTDGKTADIFSVVKQCGLDAVRLRVWVNPDGGWSGKDDVVSLARKAAITGLDIMVDFHYSDFFADPSRQTVPSAWSSDTGNLAKMKGHVSDHTTEVLQALKDAGVAPKWIQIGNETRNGMIWPTGQLWNDKGDLPGGWANFAGLYNAGYDAAKTVFPDALVMPHVDNAFDDNAWWFTKFKAAGGRMDMIALSHYPQVVSGRTWQSANQQAASRAQTLSSSFGVKVMISEIGIKASDLALGKQVLEDFLGKVKGYAAGVFYWEPEVYGGWKPAKYTSLGWNSYDMGCFNPDGSPSEAFLTLKNN